MADVLLPRSAPGSAMAGTSAVTDEDSAPNIWGVDDVHPEDLRSSSPAPLRRKGTSKSRGAAFRAGTPVSPSARTAAERRLHDLAPSSTPGPTLSPATKAAHRDGPTMGTSASTGKLTSTMRSKGSTVGGGGKPSSTSLLQADLKRFVVKTDDAKAELSSVNAQISELNETLVKMRITRGGFRAVQENQAAVARTASIMEKRLAMALAAYMKVVASNKKQRQEIDKGRHEKVTLLKASASTFKDLKAVTEESALLEEAIQRQQLKLEECQNEMEAVKEESDMKQEELEERWRVYAEMDQEIAPLPSMSMEAPASKGDGSGAGAHAHGHHSHGAGARHASPWDFGADSAEVMEKFAKVENAKEVMQEVLRLTQVGTLSAFLDRWEEAEQKNFTLYSRVDSLLEEAEQLRVEITDLRVRAASSCVRQDAENKPRKSVLELLRAKLEATKERAARQQEQAESEGTSVVAVKRGLRSLLETMDGEETEDLVDGNLMDYFGIVEQSIREVLVWYVQHTSASSGGGASKVPPVSPISSVAVGPSKSTGTLTRTIKSSVSAPSIEGPRPGDTRQSEAFRHPFLATGGSIDDDDDWADDRPILVPSPASRNLATAGLSSSASMGAFPSRASAGAGAGSAARPPSGLGPEASDTSEFSLPGLRPSSRPTSSEQATKAAAEADVPLPKLV